MCHRALLSFLKVSFSENNYKEMGKIIKEIGNSNYWNNFKKMEFIRKNKWEIMKIPKEILHKYRRNMLTKTTKNKNIEENSPKKGT